MRHPEGRPRAQHQPALKPGDLRGLTYLRTGELRHGTEALQRELGTADEPGILNLNGETNVRNRRQALLAFRDRFTKRHTGHWTTEQPRRELSSVEVGGRLPPYWGISRDWLQQQIVKHSPG